MSLHKTGGGQGVCDVAKKRFRARSAEKFQQQKIIDARTRLRSEEAVIYSPRFVSPTSLIAGKFEQGLSGEGRESNSGGALHGPHSSGCHLADHVRKHVLFYRQDMVVASGGLGRLPESIITSQSPLS